MARTFNLDRRSQFKILFNHALVTLFHVRTSISKKCSQN